VEASISSPLSTQKIRQSLIMSLLLQVLLQDLPNSPFCDRPVKALVSDAIFFQINNNKVRNSLLKYTQKNPPVESTMTKTYILVPKCYEETQQNLSRPYCSGTKTHASGSKVENVIEFLKTIKRYQRNRLHELHRSTGTLCYQISCNIITISLHVSSILISDAVGMETLVWANMAKIKADQKHVL
jgi:hypothetical protein